MKDDDELEYWKDQIGLVDINNVQIGETCPIFGMITSIREELDPPANESVMCEIEINHNIDAIVFLDKAEKVEFLKERAFEPGIFVTKLIAKDDSRIEVDCVKVIFGKREPFQVQ